MASGLQASPDVGDDFPLQVPALVHVLHAPFLDGSFVLPEHPLARTGHVGEDDVKLHLRFPVVGGIVVGDDDIGVAELLDVLRQNLGTQFHRLVAEEQTPFWQGGTQGGGLSSRGGAQVEHADGLVHQLSDDQVHHHRSGFLHIIQSGMEQGVEGEVGPFCDVSARGRAPGHFSHFPADGWVDSRALGALEGIEADARGSVFLQCPEIFAKEFPAHQVPGILAEFYR